MGSRPRLLVVSPEPALPRRSRREALVSLLRREFGAAVVAGSRPEELVARAGAALERGRRDAAVFIDGQAVRAALPAIQQGWSLPAALASFPDELVFPASWTRRLFCAPEELWRFDGGSRSLRTDGLLPWSIHSAAQADRSWVARRVGELAKGRAAGTAAPRRGLASIIVPCWNRLERTKECVEAVRRCTAKPYELILVDNGSTDGTGPYFRRLRSRGAARVIRNKTNAGFAQAINQGMKAAKGDYVVWLNNDAVVTPEWLERLVACAERAPWVGAVGPIVNEDGAALSGTPDQVAAALALRNAGQALAVHWLVGFCVLLKREALEQTGLLDLRFRDGFYEDYDYCLRLRQAGYETFIAQDAFVYHHWHQSFGQSAETGRRVQANRDRFIDKWCRSYLDALARLPNAQARADL